MVPPDKVEPFMKDLWEEFGQTSWIVGEVRECKNPENGRKVYFGDNDDHTTLNIINVSKSFLKDEE
jgi:hypothetical protein